MQNVFKSLPNLAFGAVCTLGAVSFPAIAQAAVITPSSFEATIGIGETVTVDKTITLDASGASLVDVFFLADNTGSMGGVLNSIKSNATTILDGLLAGVSDVQFGVGNYYRDPIAEFAPTTGRNGGYNLLQAITGNKTLVTNSINSWEAFGGGDFPEANFFGLHQAATSGAPTPTTNVGTGQDTGWRPGSQRVIVWFGDAPSHTATISQTALIDALVEENVIVAGINSSFSSFGGINESGQAQAIVNATGGTLTSLSSNPGNAVVDAIINAVGDAISTVDLQFLVDPVPAGVDVGFLCTDPLGCTAVPGGATRSFTVSFTGKSTGTYEFETGFVGISARELDTITVRGGDVEVIPTPALLPGLIGMGMAALRKRNQGDDTAEA